MALVQTPNMPVLADPIIPSLLSHDTDLVKSIMEEVKEDWEAVLVVVTGRSL